MSRLVLPSELPLDVLFPEEYARTKSMIAKDFAFLGATIVLSVVGLASLLSLA